MGEQMKLGMISLGCAKNLIDTELFLGVAKKYQIEITNELSQADILVVNTCGFIESAKKEAIDTILDLVEQKRNRTIIAMGCLVERYLEDLKREIPEVDIYFPIQDYDHIDEVFQKILHTPTSYSMDYTNRVITTLPHSAYLRISEGCNNRCSYCAIPLIRGHFKSRSFDSLLEEAQYLADQGVKEITLIGQDTTRYGSDLDEGKTLANLLRNLSKIESFKMIRVLYLYPDEITNELIEEIKANSKVAKYFDIPIQHASNHMLSAMNRRGDHDFLTNLIQSIRSQIPNAVIRTTLIVGFPGETKEDFRILYDFVANQKFNRLGVFTYSDEEDTPGFEMYPKVDSSIMNKRKNMIMKLQNEISLQYHQSLIGQTFDCIIDHYDARYQRYTARSYHYAPDDVDGAIYIFSAFYEGYVGTIKKVEIVEATDYDLIGIWSKLE